MNTSQFIFGDLKLAQTLGAQVSTIRTWRYKGLIPFIKTGHKSIMYQLPAVLAALEKMEQPAESKK
jgi:predicted site-specific integrase-resolvase